jgi:hypothetical protein
MKKTLDAIRQRLIDKGYTNIFINYMSQENDKALQTSRIAIMSDPASSQNNNVPTAIIRFTIYVRDNNRETASARATAIYNELMNLSMGYDNWTIHDIQGEPPYMVGLNPSQLDISEYAIRMEATVYNRDVNLYNS